eukprot:Ihof_evm4s127 gene=Ihof_evmTU4s127
MVLDKGKEGDAKVFSDLQDLLLQDLAYEFAASEAPVTPLRDINLDSASSKSFMSTDSLEELSSSDTTPSRTNKAQQPGDVSTANLPFQQSYESIVPAEPTTPIFVPLDNGGSFIQ